MIFRIERSSRRVGELIEEMEESKWQVLEGIERCFR